MPFWPGRAERINNRAPCSPHHLSLSLQRVRRRWRLGRWARSAGWMGRRLDALSPAHQNTRLAVASESQKTCRRRGVRRRVRRRGVVCVVQRQPRAANMGAFSHRHTIAAYTGKGGGIRAVKEGPGQPPDDVTALGHRVRVVCDGNDGPIGLASPATDAQAPPRSGINYWPVRCGASTGRAALFGRLSWTGPDRDSR